jgi:hypothetical protein
MEIYQLLKRGTMHREFCEDFLFNHSLSGRFWIFGVFDGCSTGTDSHFASTLFAKTIKAELNFIEKENMETADKLIDTLLFQSIQSIKEIRNALMLTTDELLTTLIVFVYDKLENTGEIIAFGDGMVSINGPTHLIDQDNQPEYLAYYIDAINTYDDYTMYLNTYARRFKVNQLFDVTISTDGISSFQSVSDIESAMDLNDICQFLVSDGYLRKNPSMLSRKCNILRTKYGMVAQDDIAMIRVIQ